LIITRVSYAGACRPLRRTPETSAATGGSCRSLAEELVDHLVGMNLVFVARLEGSPTPERGADRLGADPAGAYRRSVAALQAAAARPGVLERSQATAVGVATGIERLQWRIADLLTHGRDLAQAAGVAAGLPDDLVEQALSLVRIQLPSQPRWSRVPSW
jgi:hypothetical protein